jgi:hypothetical protein
VSAATPEMSVVLPTDTYDSIRDVVNALRAQSVQHRLEIVLVTESEADLGPDDGIAEGFHDLRVVEVDQLYPFPPARAKGVLAAGASLVLLGESHCFPDGGHCEALIRAHRGSRVVVGPAIANANPGTLRSWAALFMDYGPWVDGRPGGTTRGVPGYNSAYRRQALLDCPELLAATMEMDVNRQASLRDRGLELHFEPRAMAWHLNVSRPLAWAHERYLGGRSFAGARSLRWARSRRLLYAGAWPLIAAVRIRRIVGHIRDSGHGGKLLPRILPCLALALLLSAAGEGMGYAFGAGRATRRVNEMELYKARYVSPAERERWFPDLTPAP